jgi:uncharacterized protein
MVDISKNEMKILIGILEKHVPDCEVWAFGSRLGSDFRKYSDLDIVIKGKESLSFLRMAELRETLQQSDLAFRVDVLDWPGISEDFRKVIEKEYEVIKKA